MKVSFLGHCFPQWPSRLGKRRWRMQRNTTTAQLRKSRESATTALAQRESANSTQNTKEREREREREEGVIQSHQCPHSQDRDAELWTTNEISKSWVRYLPLSQSLGNVREVRQGEGSRCAQRKHQEHSWTHTHTKKKGQKVVSGEKKDKTFHPLLWAQECMHNHTRYQALHETQLSKSLRKVHTSMIICHSGVSPVWRLSSPADRATLMVSQQTTKTLETCNGELLAWFDQDTKPLEE